MQASGLPQALQQRESQLWALDVEDLDALREELGLVQALRQTLASATPAASKPASSAAPVRTPGLGVCLALPASQG